VRIPQIILALAACGILNTACVVTVPSSEAAKPADAKPADAKSSDASKKPDAKPVADVNDADNNIFTHEKAGIRFAKPEGWNHKADGDTITLFSPDHAVSIVITVAKKSNLKDAINEIDSELSNVMTDIETNSQAQKTDVNGMDAVTLSGTGKIQGTPVTWAVDLLDAKRPVFVITFGKQSEWGNHQDEYVEFAKSVHRA
jgi:hypothetical protein